jgi:lipopolysaccharide/colanic/teichoic acid biosynthesis glycosyltransferase
MGVIAESEHSARNIPFRVAAFPRVPFTWVRPAAAISDVVLDSPGPILFTQARNGFNNRTFRILKFRTLYTIEDGAIIKPVARNDDRVTRVGRLLRRTSIDPAYGSP